MCVFWSLDSSTSTIIPQQFTVLGWSAASKLSFEATQRLWNLSTCGFSSSRSLQWKKNVYNPSLALRGSDLHILQMLLNWVLAKYTETNFYQWNQDSMVISKNVGILEEKLSFFPSYLLSEGNIWLNEPSARYGSVSSGYMQTLHNMIAARMSWMNLNLDEQRFKSVRVCNGFKLFFIFLNVL